MPHVHGHQARVLETKRLRKYQAKEAFPCLRHQLERVSCAASVNEELTRFTETSACSMFGYTGPFQLSKVTVQPPRLVLSVGESAFVTSYYPLLGKAQVFLSKSDIPNG